MTVRRGPEFPPPESAILFDLDVGVNLFIFRQNQEMVARIPKSSRSEGGGRSAFAGLPRWHSGSWEPCFPGREGPREESSSPSTEGDFEEELQGERDCRSRREAPGQSVFAPLPARKDLDGKTPKLFLDLWSNISASLRSVISRTVPIMRDGSSSIVEGDLPLFMERCAPTHPVLSPGVHAVRHGGIGKAPVAASLTASRSSGWTDSGKRRRWLQTPAEEGRKSGRPRQTRPAHWFRYSNASCPGERSVVASARLSSFFRAASWPASARSRRGC